MTSRAQPVRVFTTRQPGCRRLRPGARLVSLVATAAVFLMALGSASASAQDGLRTRRFKESIVKSNTSKEVAVAVGERLDNFCEVFGEFYDGLGLKPKSSNKAVARLFDTYEEYAAQYARENPGRDPPLAFFSPSRNALVLYNDEADLTLRQTLFHEASHQYMNRYTEEAPKWLNEGLAEYFEGWRMSAEGHLLEKRVNIYDLSLVQGALQAERYLRPRDLVAMDWKEFRDFREVHPEFHPYLHYVTSWSIIWFCLEESHEGDRDLIVQLLRDLMEKGGTSEFQVGDWDGFEARWREAILGLDSQPVDAIDHLLLARGHRSNERFQEAAELYEKTIELDPAIKSAYYQAGNCRARMGQLDVALDWLAKAREVDPGNPSVLRLLARIHMWKGEEADLERALEIAEESLKIVGKKSPPYLELLARCQAANGDKRGAVRTCRKILRLVEEDDEIAYYEALVEELGA